jgi:hypothetical protein
MLFQVLVKMKHDLKKKTCYLFQAVMKTPVQCTADNVFPTTSSSVCPASPASSLGSESAQLPAFNDLLADDLKQKAPRPYRRKTRDSPYEQPPCRRGAKVMRTNWGAFSNDLVQIPSREGWKGFFVWQNWMQYCWKLFPGVLKNQV